MTGHVSLLPVSLAQLARPGASAASLPLRSVLLSLRAQALALAPLEFGRACAQHEVREVQVELMRRHVGAFDHETEVAERAGLDHIAENRAVYRIELAGLGLVDEVEQRWEGVAEIEAAPAAMTNVEDAAQLRVDLLGVREVRIPPVDGMPDRRVQSAFAHGLVLESSIVFGGPGRRFPGSHVGPPLLGRVSPWSRAPFGSGRRGFSPPWPGSRTSRRSRRSPLRGQNAPCPGTYRCTHRSRRRSRL